MKKINKENINEILTEIEERAFDIPFSNSEFQSENFIFNSSITPTRAYRASLLQLQEKIKALKEATFAKKLADVKIRRKEVEKKSSLSLIEEEDSLYQLDVYEKEIQYLHIEKLDIQIEKIRESFRQQEKLFSDALHEIEYFYNKILKMPRYTRKEFEEGEREYYEISLKKQAVQITGAMDSLLAMGVDVTDPTVMSGIIQKLDTSSLALKIDKQRTTLND